MTIRYKSETFDLTTTNVTTSFNVSSDATIIVKSVQAVTILQVDVDTDLFYKIRRSDVEISHAQLNKSLRNLVKDLKSRSK